MVFKKFVVTILGVSILSSTTTPAFVGQTLTPQIILAEKSLFGSTAITPSNVWATRSFTDVGADVRYQTPVTWRRGDRDQRPFQPDVFIQTFQNFITQKTGIHLRDSQIQIVREFFTYSSFNQFPVSLRQRLRHGIAAGKFGILIYFVYPDHRFHIDRFGEFITKHLDPFPNFKDLVGSDWPADSPLPSANTRALIELVLSLIDEQDSSGRAIRQFMRPYAESLAAQASQFDGVMVPESEAIPVQDFVMTWLGQIIQQWVPIVSNPEEWLSAAFNIAGRRDNSYLIWPDRISAMAGDAIQDLLVSREIVRQHFDGDQNSLNALRRSLLSGQAQSDFYHVFFEEREGFFAGPFSIENQSTLFEDLSFLIFKQVEQHAGGGLLALEKAHLDIYLNAVDHNLLPPSTVDFIRRWSDYRAIPKAVSQKNRTTPFSKLSKMATVSMNSTNYNRDRFAHFAKQYLLQLSHDIKSMPLVHQSRALKRVMAFLIYLKMHTGQSIRDILSAPVEWPSALGINILLLEILLENHPSQIKGFLPSARTASFTHRHTMSNDRRQRIDA